MKPISQDQMATTSNRTEIDLSHQGPAVDFTGWTYLDHNIYYLWLSPCKTWLVQHYYRPEESKDRFPRSAFEQDIYISTGPLRQFPWMPRVTADKMWDFQIIHDFQNCEWLGNEPLRPEVKDYMRQLEEKNLAWPTIEPRNCYWDHNFNMLRVFGAFLCFEHGSQPMNLDFWSQGLTAEHRGQIANLPKQEGRYLDWRLWHKQKFDSL